MGKSRTARREATGEFFLFAAETTLGWRMIRNIKFFEGERGVLAGSYRRVYDAFEHHIGFQVLTKLKTGNEIPGRGPSPTYISARELMLNAGLFGKSRTRGLPEDKRISRHARFDPDKILAPEDAIERAQAKVAQWPFPASRIDKGKGEPKFGDRAVRVYPKPA